MTDSISDIRFKIKSVLDDTPVKNAILFGSYAKGNFSANSDIDIVIDGEGKLRGIDFYGILEDITTILGKPVDLIEASQIVNGSKVEEEIKLTGVLVYER